MLVSHDIGAIGSVSHRIAVFYAGRIVESGSAEQVLRTPRMPYTMSLLAALPRVGADRLESIAGAPPDFAKLPEGCSFAPRCKFRIDKCAEDPMMEEMDPGHYAACWRRSENLTQLNVAK